MEKYGELSYRDIQARAKELGIAANKKREVLIEAILEAEQASPIVESEVVEMEPTVEPEVVFEPIVELSVEPAVVVEEVKVEESPIAAVPEVEVEAVEQAEENVLDQSLEYFDSYPEEPEDEEYHECDTGDLIDAFEGMQLRGIPNPTGVKTVFDGEENSTQEPGKIDWGIDFDAENIENNQFVDNLPVPCGKHTIFSSPDLKMGKGVHWHYEDFDKKSVVVKTPSAAAKSAPASAAKPVGGAVTPSKNMSADDRVQFWLAKGPKTPIR